MCGSKSSKSSANTQSTSQADSRQAIEASGGTQIQAQGGVYFEQNVTHESATAIAALEAGTAAALLSNEAVMTEALDTVETVSVDAFDFAVDFSARGYELLENVLDDQRDHDLAVISEFSDTLDVMSLRSQSDAVQSQDQFKKLGMMALVVAGVVFGLRG